MGGYVIQTLMDGATPVDADADDDAPFLVSLSTAQDTSALHLAEPVDNSETKDDVAYSEASNIAVLCMSFDLYAVLICVLYIAQTQTDISSVVLTELSTVVHQNFANALFKLFIDSLWFIRGVPKYQQIWLQVKTHSTLYLYSHQSESQ
jgi:hypothetical protein